MEKFNEGDFVKCTYEGKEYKGLILGNPKEDIFDVRIMVSSRRTEPPIFEEVKVSLDCLQKFF